MKGLPLDEAAAERGGEGYAIRKMINASESCIPAIVEEVKNGMALVRVAIRIPARLQSNPNNISYIDNASYWLPVMAIGCTLGMVVFPVAKGDTGWIIAGDRNTEIFKKTKKVSDPNTMERHRYAQGVFIPDFIWAVPPLQGLEDSLRVQTADGSAVVAVGKDSVSIRSSLTVKVQSPTVEIQGNVVVHGSITADGDMVANGTSAHGHTHPYNDGDTGPPN